MQGNHARVHMIALHQLDGLSRVIKHRARLFVAEDRFDALCHLGEGLFPAAAST